MTNNNMSLRPELRNLAALEARVKQDRADLCVPAANWVSETQANGKRVLDVVIVGGGMCGLVAQHALTSGGISNIAQFDRNPAGSEGPWITYARMQTLRSPKQLTGPAYGYASLTFQAWFRAQHGKSAWDAMGKIPRLMWMEYLSWYRNVLNLRVQNNVSVDRISGDNGLVRLHLSGTNAPAQTVLARKVVMATGRDGTGLPNIPAFITDVPRGLWAHSADEIDFTALKGKRVIVVGVGASAIDNAAEALEAGAAEVRHLIRRTEMPTINKMMGIGSFGFTSGYRDLPDEWRWRLMHYSFLTQTPPPRGSTLRVSTHPNAYFHFGKSVEKIERQGIGLRLTNTDGSIIDTDFLILGTGFRTDPMDRREFGDDAGNIELWRDVYTPPSDEQNGDLANFPYLNPDFSFRGKTLEATAWLANVYCFNYGASASMGKLSGDIPGISEGANLLVTKLASTLYGEDIEHHWQNMQDYSVPELLGDEWAPSNMPNVVSRSTEDVS